MNNFALKILFLITLFIFSDAVKANYWPVIGTYKKGPGGRTAVTCITSISLHNISPLIYGSVL